MFRDQALDFMRRLFFKPGMTCGLAAALVTGCQTSGHGSHGTEAEVRAVLEQQVRNWNAGNLASFMEIYARSDRTRFASGGDISLGWQTVFDRYRKKYGDRAAMGTLRFSDLEVSMLAPDATLAFGRWRLQREKDQPSGLFTLILRKTPEGWRIVHDHTSSASNN
jgi:ketosteroid isomerase-like protein